MAPAHLGEALREIACDEDSKLLTGFDEIGKRRFHAGAAGSRDDLHKGILRAKDGAKVAANLFRNLKEKRIQMTDDGLPHGLIDAGMNLRGAGGKQQAARRIYDGHEPSV